MKMEALKHIKTNIKPMPKNSCNYKKRPIPNVSICSVDNNKSELDD